MDAIEDAGEALAHVFENRRVSKFWYIWKRVSTLRVTESLLVERVNLRVMSDAVAMWRKRM